MFGLPWTILPDDPRTILINIFSLCTQFCKLIKWDNESTFRAVLADDSKLKNNFTNILNYNYCNHDETIFSFLIHLQFNMVSRSVTLKQIQNLPTFEIYCKNFDRMHNNKFKIFLTNSCKFCFTRTVTRTQNKKVGSEEIWSFFLEQYCEIIRSCKILKVWLAQQRRHIVINFHWEYHVCWLCTHWY